MLNMSEISPQNSPAWLLPRAQYECWAPACPGARVCPLMIFWAGAAIVRVTVLMGLARQGVICSSYTFFQLGNTFEYKQRNMYVSTILDELWLLKQTYRLAAIFIPCVAQQGPRAGDSGCGGWWGPSVMWLVICNLKYPGLMIKYKTLKMKEVIVS